MPTRVPDERIQEIREWANREKGQGMNQLDQLNAMERQQDVNIWTSSTLFSAIHGILLVALFSGTGSTSSFIFLGVIGLIVNLAWAITIFRGRFYEHRWIQRAVTLQKALGVPEEVAIWDEEPRGLIRGWMAYAILLSLFTAVWIFLIGVAVGALGITIR